MKKILLLILVSILLSSCVTSYVSSNDYLAQIETVKDNYSDLGYRPTKLRKTINEEIEGATSYHLGYGIKTTNISKDIIYRDTYTFENENRDNAIFSIQYQKIDGEDGLYNINICDCETDDIDMYDKLCDNENLQKISNLPKNYKYIDPGLTSLCASFGFIVGFSLLVLFANLK